MKVRPQLQLGGPKPQGGVGEWGGAWAGAHAAVLRTWLGCLPVLLQGRYQLACR